MEFIQNAEDAGSHSMEVSLSSGQLVVTNNGRPFDNDDVDSICKIGKSSKSAERYIGYLGVGFKSTFLIADRVEIHSGTYRFAFDSKASATGAAWQIMPVWVNKVRDNGPFDTMFRLTRLNQYAVQSLKQSFSSFEPRTLLWLDNLTHLAINDGATTRHYERKKVGRDRWRLTVNEDGSVSDEDWLVVTRDCAVPPHVREDQMTIDYERDQVTVRRVAAAFRLDGSRNLTPEQRGTAYIRIYSYTPISDEAVSLNFLVQGDFITAPNRESVQREAEWNKWLADEAYRLVTEMCVPMFTKHRRWRNQFQDILEVASVGNHPISDELLRRPLAQFLSTAPIFPAVDGSLVTFEEAIKVPPKMQALLAAEELKALYPNRKMVSHHVSFDVEQAPDDRGGLVCLNSAARFDKWNRAAVR